MVVTFDKFKSLKKKGGVIMDCKYCTKEAKHGGLCGGHYKRLYRYGDPLAWDGTRKPKDLLVEREVFAAAIEEGLTTQQLADRFLMSYSSVCRYKRLWRLTKKATTV